MAENPTPDWRNQGAAAPGGAAGKRDWQVRPEARGPSAPMARGTRVALAVGLLALVTAGVVAAVRMLHLPTPSCLVLVGASYDLNLALPHNAYGWQGLTSLAGLADEPTTAGLLGSGRPKVLHRAELKGDAGWAERWKDVPATFEEETLVLVVALHGGADRDGPYLLPDDRKAQQRVPLDQLLTSLGEPGLRDKNVLLVLEPALVSAHWPTGMLHNDFVARLKEHPKLKEMPNLMVLCASDADQVSWASEEWQQTIFLHYLGEGLRGAADLDHNNRVTAAELFRYLSVKVQGWAQANRGVEQTPILLGDTGRAEDVELALVRDPYVEVSPDQAPGNAYSPNRDLAYHWGVAAALRNMVPHPAVYAPQLWRVYLESVQRLEQLDRAGYAKHSAARYDELKGQIARVAEAIQAQAGLDRSRPDQAAWAVGAALPLPAALAIAPAAASDDDGRFLAEAFGTLWDAKKPEVRKATLDRVKAWAKEKADGRDEKVVQQLVRTHLYRTLLDRLKKGVRPADLGLDPADKGDEKPAVRTLIDLVQGDGTRPAEVHFLLMLVQDVSRTNPPDPDLLRKAVEVRLLAEEAALAAPAGGSGHPYSEAVFAWVRGKVEKADAARRPGEDGLFASAAKDQKNAAELLDRARTLYTEALQEARVVRDALDARDRALADLPLLAQWVAAQRPSSNRDREATVNAWVGRVEDLARDVAALAEQLKANNPARLREAIEPVRTNHDQLRAEHEADAGSLEPEVHLQGRWHDTEALLAVPLLPEAGGRLTDAVSNRMKLLANSRRTSAKFNRMSEGDKIIRLRDEERDPSGVRLGVHRQKRMALATLAPFEPIQRPDDTPGRVGLAVGAAFGRVARNLDAAFREGQGSFDAKEARQKLADADTLCRALPAGMEPFMVKSPYAPPEGLRRLRLHDLFVAQAERTLKDHWYAERESAVERTYYRPTARGYLTLAQALVEEKIDDEELRKARGDIAGRLLASAKESGLRLPARREAAWTSEREFLLAWTLEADADRHLEPLGVPMTWLEVQGSAAPADDRPAGLRSPVTAVGPLPAVPIVRPASAADGPVVARLVALYRGQRIESAVDVVARSPDTIVHRFPAPDDRAGIAVRLDKQFTYGAMCIVLDCSGSMAIRHPDPDSPRARFDFAVEALDTALKTVPDNTELGVLTFLENKDGTFDFTLVREPSPWQKGQHRSLMDQVRGLRVELKRGSRSPIAQGLVEAKRRGFPANFKGPKLLLALTDGDDNRTGRLRPPEEAWPSYDTSPEAYNAAVQDLLVRQFRATNTVLHVVCFNKAKDAEALRAEDQFKVVTDAGKFTNPGTFTVTPTAAQLAAALERAIRPRLRLYENGADAPPPFPADGMFANAPQDRALDWQPIRPGTYQPGLPWPVRNTLVTLGKGQLMFLSARRGPDNEVVFERGLMGKEYPGHGPDPVVTKRGKLLALLDHQFNDRTGQLWQLATVEHLPPPFAASEVTLEQPQPRFVWIETTPDPGDRPRLVRWFQEHAYPAPAFRLEIDAWPYTRGTPAPATTRVWTTDRPLDETVAPAVPLDLRRPPRGVKVPGTGIVIEDVTVEPHALRDVAGHPAPSQPCLVVRLSHPDKGKHAVVRLEGVTARGEEHRYYADAGKSAAFFWGLPELDGKTLTLRVVNLAAVKEICETATFRLAAPVVNPTVDLRAKVFEK